MPSMTSTPEWSSSPRVRDEEEFRLQVNGESREVRCRPDAPLLYLLRRRGWVTPLGGPLVLPRRPIRRANLTGSAVFGAGWALTGSCPGPALASVAGGNIVGIWVMAGLFSGIWLYETLAARRGLTASSPSAMLET